MRLTSFVFAVLVASMPAAAQGWKEYAYPDFAFSVAFPAEPRIESATYRSADGNAVDARIYSVAHENGVFRMMIADLPRAEESAVLDHAVKTLAQGGEIKVDIPHRIRQVYGRQLSIAGTDGSQSLVAVFYHRQRLYQIEGKALVSAGSATGDAIRFQQSLDFTGGSSNR
jgi:hypothetical protein